MPYDLWLAKWRVLTLLSPTKKLKIFRHLGNAIVYKSHGTVWIKYPKQIALFVSLSLWPWWSSFSVTGYTSERVLTLTNSTLWAFTTYDMLFYLSLCGWLWLASHFSLDTVNYNFWAIVKVFFLGSVQHDYLVWLDCNSECDIVNTGIQWCLRVHGWTALRWRWDWKMLFNQ